MKVVDDDERYSDNEFIEAIRAGGVGRQRASDWFYKRYHRYIFEAKKKYHISEDEGISAYLSATSKVIKAIDDGKFEGKSQLSTYLYSIFSRSCVDEKRLSPSNRYIHEELSSIAHLADHAQNQLKDLLTSESAKILGVLMKGISERCRDLLTAIELDGFSMDDVAKLLGISVASVPQTKYRCMEKLRLAAQSSKLF
ncbi:MAG: RNA polymerase sigma factor [Bacteroidia bacterium]